MYCLYEGVGCLGTSTRTNVKSTPKHVQHPVVCLECCLCACCRILVFLWCRHVSFGIIGLWYLVVLLCDVIRYYVTEPTIAIVCVILWIHMSSTITFWHDVWLAHEFHVRLFDSWDMHISHVQALFGEVMLFWNRSWYGVCVTDLGLVFVKFTKPLKFGVNRPIFRILQIWCK